MLLFPFSLPRGFSTILSVLCVCFSFPCFLVVLSVSFISAPFFLLSNFIFVSRCHPWVLLLSRMMIYWSEGSQNNFSTGEHKAASKGFKKDKIFFFLSKKHPSLESSLLKGSTIPWKVSTTSLHCQTVFRHFEKIFNHRKNGPFIDRS